MVDAWHSKGVGACEDKEDAEQERERVMQVLHG